MIYVTQDKANARSCEHGVERNRVSLCVVTLRGLVGRFLLEDGRSIFLRNSDIYRRVHTMLQRRGPTYM
jgi:hypothetical protein